MSYQNPTYGYSPIEVDVLEQKRNRDDRKMSIKLCIFQTVLVTAFLYYFVANALDFGNLRREGVSMTIPFKYIDHPMQPSIYWGSVSMPYPTGAFWTNLVIYDGKGQTTTAAGVLPYGVCTTASGVQVSYGATRRYVTQLEISDPFAVDMQLGALEGIVDWGVARYDNLSVTMQLNTSTSGSLITYLVKSSPFITVEYTEATPVISSEVMSILNVEGQLVEGVEGTFYIVTLGNYQNWLVYCSVPVSFTLNGNTLTAPYAITGVIRIAFLPAQNLQPSFNLLTQYVECYPTGGDVTLSYNSDVTATVSFTYITEGPGQLLMLALPHHMDVIALPELDDTQNLEEIYAPVYSCKGKMIPIIGKTWNLIYNLEQVSWNYNVKEELSISELNAIADSLQSEVNISLPNAVDPYNFGKQIARLARLVCIADYLGIPNSKAIAIANIETALTPWLTGANIDPLLYDQTYGGIVTTDGILNDNADYGNGWYNDHHFHYGYFVYAFAALAQYDPNYWTTYRSAMDSIMRDICSYSADPNFPSLRHKDFFDGHSWASGLFVQENAKNQESSSEAVNAYYSCFLYSSATGDLGRMAFSQLALTMEIQAIKYYWHMPNGSTIYDPIFAANTMAGNIGALSVTTSTWFGDNPEYVHGINIIPVTPATALLLDTNFVESEWPVLGNFLPDQTNVVVSASCALNPSCAALGLTGNCCPSTDSTYLGCCPVTAAYAEWIGYMYADHAVVNSNAAWDQIMAVDVNVGFGPGDSKTNLLFWAASQPAPPASYEDVTYMIDFNTTIKPSCADNSACAAQGLTGMCCPTGPPPYGISLGCCPKVQYPLAEFT